MHTIESFLRQIVPDLEGVPLYVIGATGPPPGILPGFAAGCHDK